MGGNRTPHALLVEYDLVQSRAIIFTNHLTMPIPLSEFFRLEKQSPRSIKGNMHGGEFAKIWHIFSLLSYTKFRVNFCRSFKRTVEFIK